MSQENEDGGGLAAMLGDALMEDAFEADLLLRYGRDPEALEPVERERVEAYLAASPAHRQQLRSLLRFVEARGELAGVEGSRPGDRVSGGAVTELATHRRSRVQAAWIGGAIAAGLAGALLYLGPGRELPGEVRSDVQLADEATTGVEPLVPPTPTEGRSEHPLAPELDRQEVEITQTDEAGLHSPEAPISRSADGDGLALAEGESSPPQAPTVETGADRAIETRRIHDEKDTHEPLLLAANVSGPLRYMRPADAIELPSPGALREGGSALPVLQALAPSHVALTLSASPTLYWYISKDTNRPVELVLADRVSVDPILEATVEPPITAGIHRISLAEHDIALEQHKEYRWFVSLPSNGTMLSQELVARGAILLADEPADLKEALEAAAVGEQGRIYAEQGLWYDALDFISRVIERAPTDVRLRELRAGLLDAGGLTAAAQHDRHASGMSASH